MVGSSRFHLTFGRSQCPDLNVYLLQSFLNTVVEICFCLLLDLLNYLILNKYQLYIAHGKHSFHVFEWEINATFDCASVCYSQHMS